MDTNEVMRKRDKRIYDDATNPKKFDDDAFFAGKRGRISRRKEETPPKKDTLTF